MKKAVILALVLSATLLLNGCGNKSGKVLARVNNEVITVGEFNKRIEKLPKHFRNIVSGQERKFLDDIIMENLLYEEALKSKIDKDAETQEIIEEARKKIIISSLIKKRVDDNIATSEADIKKYYDEHSEEFMLPERWRASHILVDTLKEAESVKKELDEGAVFVDLAKERSKDPTSKQGGDVGFFSKGQLLPEFEEESFKLKVGEISDIIKTQFGYHVIKLTDRKSPVVQAFENVGELIKKELRRDQKKQLIKDLMTNLRNNAKITVSEKVLEELAKESAADAPEPKN